MGRNKLTHEECCALVEGSIEKGLQTLLYIRTRLVRLKTATLDEWEEKRCHYMTDVLCRIDNYGAYLHGMVQILLKLRDCGLLEEARPKGGKRSDVIPHAKGNGLIYNKAIIDLLLDNTLNLERFIDGYEIRFTDFETDKKGKLVKCRAYFAKRVTMYQEVK